MLNFFSGAKPNGLGAINYIAVLLGFFSKLTLRSLLERLVIFLFCSLVASNIAVADNSLTTLDIAKSLSSHARDNRFPLKLQFSPSSSVVPVDGYVQYTFDSRVHQDMAEVYLRYQPDYACFVALDVDSGAILNLTSFIKNEEEWDNLVLRSNYPAASVFKMITAAAVLDMGKVTPATVIPFNGKSTTLYKSQVLSHKKTKWTRTPTLKESFAKSVNPVFAQLGIFQVGAEKLQEYANKFGFERLLRSDFELPMSRIGLELDTPWEVAEAASGFTKDITLSPVHAAQMAAIIANGGNMVTPYMVESVLGLDGKRLYQAQTSALKPQAERVISAETAAQMRSLMRETTRIGSARKAFHGLSRYKVYNDMEIGGKTGSLTGYSPKGRHDWFVGYAEKDGKRIAYASLIINKEKWYVRSAYVARQFIYHYFTQADDDSEMASAKPLVESAP